MKKAIKELIESLPTITYEDLILTGKKGPDGEFGTWVERNVKIEARHDHDEACLIIDGCNSHYADYYGEFRGGYPWVHPALEKWAEERNLTVDWYDPGTLFVSVLEVAA